MSILLFVVKHLVCGLYISTMELVSLDESHAYTLQVLEFLVCTRLHSQACDDSGVGR